MKTVWQKGIGVLLVFVLLFIAGWQTHRMLEKSLQMERKSLFYEGQIELIHLHEDFMHEDFMHDVSHDPPAFIPFAPREYVRQPLDPEIHFP